MRKIWLIILLSSLAAAQSTTYFSDDLSSGNFSNFTSQSSEGANCSYGAPSIVSALDTCGGQACRVRPGHTYSMGLRYLHYPSFGIASIQGDGANTVSVVTLAAHPYQIGDSIAISHTANYNGSYTVATTSDNTHLTFSKTPAGSTLETSASFSDGNNSATIGKPCDRTSIPGNAHADRNIYTLKNVTPTYRQICYGAYFYFPTDTSGFTGVFNGTGTASGLGRKMIYPKQFSYDTNTMWHGLLSATGVTVSGTQHLLMDINIHGMLLSYNGNELPGSSQADMWLSTDTWHKCEICFTPKATTGATTGMSVLLYVDDVLKFQHNTFNGSVCNTGGSAICNPWPFDAGVGYMPTDVAWGDQVDRHYGVAVDEWRFVSDPWVSDHPLSGVTAGTVTATITIDAPAGALSGSVTLNGTCSTDAGGQTCNSWQPKVCDSGGANCANIGSTQSGAGPYSVSWNTNSLSTLDGTYTVMATAGDTGANTGDSALASAAIKNAITPRHGVKH